METPSRSSERDNPLPRSSPSTTEATTTTATTTPATNIKGLPPPPPAPTQGLPPLTPKTILRSDANPYPTTFIQADTASFKQVVQMLTGSSDTSSSARSAVPSAPAPPSHRTGPKKQPFKLYERRQSGLRGLKINPLVPGLYKYSASSSVSPRNQDVLSPSVLDFPSLVLSPVTPLNPDDDPFDRASSGPNSSEEERAIAERGFYLHPSPRAAKGEYIEPPRLLPLFPLTSPRLATAAASSPLGGRAVAAAAVIVPVSSSACSSTTS